jgi:hypothetical protein
VVWRQRDRDRERERERERQRERERERQRQREVTYFTDFFQRSEVQFGRPTDE